MANLVKEAKNGRSLPRVTKGTISTGARITWSAADTEGMCQPSGEYHTLDIWQGTGSERVEYQLQLTDDEMVRVTSEWLTTLNRRRIDAARRAELGKLGR